MTDSVVHAFRPSFDEIYHWLEALLLHLEVGTSVPSPLQGNPLSPGYEGKHKHTNGKKTETNSTLSKIDSLSLKSEEDEVSPTR